MYKLWKKFVSDEQGLETVEYALMASIFILGLGVAIGLLATAVDTRFRDAAEAVDPA